MLYSRLSRFRATACAVPLLPKLRGQFAEFLNVSSLEHLGILTPVYQWRIAVRTPIVLTTRIFWTVWTQLSHLGLPRNFPLSSAYRRSGFSCFNTPRIGNAPCPMGTLNLSYCVPPLLITKNWWCRNVDLLSIAYPIWVKLRVD
jgi:hypothetical protein